MSLVVFFKIILHHKTKWFFFPSLGHGVGKKQIFIKDMSEISLYIDSHLVGKRVKRMFSRRMRMVFGFGLNHTPLN
jgi:hypothetical protein